MLSIARYMDGATIAQQVRMEKQVSPAMAFLLVEGGTDVKRFKGFTDETRCVVVNCWGRKKAIDALRVLNRRGLPGVLAAVDADFDRIRKQVLRDRNLVLSSAHDFDLDWVQGRPLRQYLDQVADDQKVLKHGGVEKVFDKIVNGLLPVSSARLLNAAGKIEFKVSEINVSDHFENFSVKLDAYIEALTEDAGADVQRKQKLKSLIEQTAGLGFDILQMTNGHDFYSALGASLRTELGERKTAQSYGSECEMHIRLCFTREDFISTDLFNQLRKWERANPKFSLLCPTLLTPETNDDELA